MATFDDVVEAIFNSPAAQVSGGQRSRGTAFEVAVKYFLEHDPEWSSKLQNVWFWKQPNPLNPAGKDNDYGIDLVAEDFFGEVYAIQAKFYNSAEKLGANEIGAFWGEVDRAGTENNIKPKCIIAETGAGLTDHERRVAASQGAIILDEKVFDDEFFDWSEFLGDKNKQHLYEPRDYQQTAINDCLKGFEDHDRGKLIMACGTGKTLTALRLAEALKSECDQRIPEETHHPYRVLFLAPSIALVSQTFQYWTHQAKERMDSFLICSDQTANKKSGSDDPEDSVLDIPFPVTTDPQQLCANAKAAAASAEERNIGMSVVFSTYQSIEVTINAQRGGAAGI